MLFKDFSYTAKTVCDHNREVWPCGYGISNQAKIMENLIFLCRQNVMWIMTAL